jgi:hypothetical protein
VLPPSLLPLLRTNHVVILVVILWGQGRFLVANYPSKYVEKQFVAVITLRPSASAIPRSINFFIEDGFISAEMIRVNVS